MGRGEKFIKIEQVRYDFSKKYMQFFFLIAIVDVFLILLHLFIIKPPASFLQAMEEYVREAPRASTVRKDSVSNLLSCLDKCQLSLDGASKHRRNTYIYLCLTSPLTCGPDYFSWAEHVKILL